MRESVLDRAQGRWHGILSALGIPADALRNKHQPCPMCKGKDRYRFDDRDGRGTFFCSQCGAGDGMGLLMKFHGWDFKEAAAKVDDVVGGIKARPIRTPREEAVNRKALNDLWRSSTSVERGDPVDQWLRRRVGEIDVPSALRFAPEVRYQAEPPTFHPCMVARVTGPDGKPATLHRTYLTNDGQKAPVEAPRRLMPGKVPDGSAVRLSAPAAVLGIAEGIETALAAGIIFKVPCWAALTEGMMQKWIPPAGTERVIVFGDRDASFTGQAAAFILAKRLVKTMAVSVEIPDEVGDWNDILKHYA